MQVACAKPFQAVNGAGAEQQRADLESPATPNTSALCFRKPNKMLHHKMITIRFGLHALVNSHTCTHPTIALAC
jgi:hypothetical protein